MRELTPDEVIAFAERWTTIARDLGDRATEVLVSVPGEELELLAFWACAGGMLTKAQDAEDCCNGPGCSRSARWRVRWDETDLLLCDVHKARIDRMANAMSTPVTIEAIRR